MENASNLGLIIAIIGSAFGILAIVVVLVLWLRTEANADRRDIVNLIIAMKEEWAHESRDFHGRLCVIEQERNQILKGRK